MKLVSYKINNRESFGIFTDEGIIDLRSRLNGEVSTLKDLLGVCLASVKKIAEEAKVDYSLDEISLQPVIPNPGAIYCLGMNTHSHCKEVADYTGKESLPPKPYIFMRTARTQAAHNEALECPNASPLFDFEGEIAIVIGKFGRHISKENALDYIAGYSCYNDGSVRDYQFHSPMFTAGKNFPRTGGFGPWMVTSDEIDSPESMKLTTTLNGEVVQQMTYDDLIYSFPEIISYISEFSELHPGDVIVTGSAAGVGLFRKPQLWMKDGDICNVEVTGIGTLSNPIVEVQGENRAPITRTDSETVFKESLQYLKH